jgi:hypothetical protein
MKLIIRNNWRDEFTTPTLRFRTQRYCRTGNAVARRSTEEADVSALAPSIEHEAATPAAIAAEIPESSEAGLPRADGASRGECTCPEDCVRDHPNE